jgi:hypothetical protein
MKAEKTSEIFSFRGAKNGLFVGITGAYYRLFLPAWPKFTHCRWNLTNFKKN